MGKWVIFVGDENFDLDIIRAMSFEGKIAIKDYGKNQIDVFFHGCDKAYVSFQFDADGWIMNDYSPEVVKKLPYKNPQFILMRYSEKSLLEKIVSSKDFPKDVLIDCDGVDLGLDQFIDKSRLLNNSEP